MITPAVSRPPPPIVDPVEHDGIRYIQDDHDSRAGDQNGGYLAAIDIKSGARLWRLKVYNVTKNQPMGLPAFGIYFRFMRIVKDGAALEIEDEVGSLYRVDLVTHEVTQIGGPPETAPPAKPAPPKPKPPIQ